MASTPRRRACARALPRRACACLHMRFVLEGTQYIIDAAELALFVKTL